MNTTQSTTAQPTLKGCEVVSKQDNDLRKFSLKLNKEQQSDLVFLLLSGLSPSAIRKRFKSFSESHLNDLIGTRNFVIERIQDTYTDEQKGGNL